VLLVWKKPIKVLKVHDTEYEIVFEQMSDCEKLKGFNGKNFSNTTIQVKVTQVEPLLGLEEIFAVVGQKLTLRDRQDLLQNNYSSNYGKQRARGVGANPDKTKGGGQGSGSPKSRPDSFPKANSNIKPQPSAPRGAGFDQPPGTGPEPGSERTPLQQQQPVTPATTVSSGQWPNSPFLQPVQRSWRPPTPGSGKGWKGGGPAPNSWVGGKGFDQAWTGGRGFPQIKGKGKGKGKDGQKGKGSGRGGGKA